MTRWRPQHLVGPGAAAPARRHSLRGDRGSGTVLVLAAVGVVLTLLVAGMTMTSAVLARHRAESAADLGALAAAASPERGCTAAAAIVRANGGVLSSCELRESVAHVSVQVRPGFRWLRPAQARARAGRGPAP